MQVTIQYKDEPVAALFCKTGSHEQRLWLYDPRPVSYRTVGAFCPHIYTSPNECLDCSQVYEGEADEN